MQLIQSKSPQKITKWLGLSLTALVIVTSASWQLAKIQPLYCTRQPLANLLEKTLNNAKVSQGHCAVRTGLILLLLPSFWLTYHKSKKAGLN